MNAITLMEKTISKSYKEIQAIKIVKKGATLYENTFSDNPVETRYHIFSVTKSIMGLLVGICIDKGYIESENVSLGDFFGDRFAKITLKDVLTMHLSYKFKKEPYEKYFTSMDYLDFVLEQVDEKKSPGKFTYSPVIGPDILSGVIMKATGKSVREFAVEKLFEPLGIEVSEDMIFHSREEQMDFYESYGRSGWVADKCGHNTAGFGLMLSVEDLCKIGEMIAAGGVYAGKRLLSQDWIDKMSTPRDAFMDMTYGYLWWIPDEKHGAVAAVGDGCNILYCNRENALVVAVTGMFRKRHMDITKLLMEDILPIFFE